MTNYSNLEQNQEIVKFSKRQFLENATIIIGIIVLTNLIMTVLNNIPLFGSFLMIGVVGPIAYGQSNAFLKISRSYEVVFEDGFAGFINITTPLVTGLLQFLYITLWSFLLIVPGIIAMINYSQAYFLLLDNPGLTASNAITLSKRMMNGLKMKYFTMLLSFFGWGILVAIVYYLISLVFGATSFLSIIFTTIVGAPLTSYMGIARANFYNNLIANYEDDILQISKGVVNDLDETEVNSDAEPTKINLNKDL